MESLSNEFAFVFIASPSGELEYTDAECTNKTNGELDSPYLEAECWGRAKRDCSSLYSKCSMSPLDFISDIY